MTIEFRCPECQKMLRVQTESAGAKAKCPQCSAVVDVPSAESTGAGLQGSDPFAEGAPPFQPAAKPTSDGSVNPYQSPTSGHEAVSSKPSSFGELVATPVPSGPIITYAWEVWKSNLGILVCVNAVVLGSSFCLAPLQGSDVDDPLFRAAISIFASCLQVFLGIGQAQILLKLLRGQPVVLAELFMGGPLFPRVLGASILAGLAMAIGLLAFIVPLFILSIIFWPFYWLLVDEKATAIESFSMASAIGKANAGTTVILWLASVGISIVGLLACCVGVLFAAPLAGLMWGAAYLMMSGQLSTKPQF